MLAPTPAPSFVDATLWQELSAVEQAALNAFAQKYRERNIKQFLGIICTSWQVLALTAEPAVLAELCQAASEYRDSAQNTLGHYLALREDNIACLPHIPAALYTMENKRGITIAHYAARSGDPRALDWMKEHYPDTGGLMETIGLMAAPRIARQLPTESVSSPSLDKRGK